MEEIKKLYDALVSLPKDWIEAIVVQLIAEDKISYDSVSKGYIKRLQILKAEQSRDYDLLQAKIVTAYCGYKKDYEKNIGDCIRYLHEKGRVNLSGKDKEKLGIK